MSALGGVRRLRALRARKGKALGPEPSEPALRSGSPSRSSSPTRLPEHGTWREPCFGCESVVPCGEAFTDKGLQSQAASPLERGFASETEVQLLVDCQSVEVVQGFSICRLGAGPGWGGKREAKMGALLSVASALVDGAPELELVAFRTGMHLRSRS